MLAARTTAMANRQRQRLAFDIYFEIHTHSYNLCIMPNTIEHETPPPTPRGANIRELQASIRQIYQPALPDMQSIYLAHIRKAQVSLYLITPLYQIAPDRTDLATRKIKKYITPMVQLKELVLVVMEATNEDVQTLWGKLEPVLEERQRRLRRELHVEIKFGPESEVMRYRRSFG